MCKKFKDRRKKRLIKQELEILYLWEEKYGLNEVQYKLICSLSKELMKLEKVTSFNIKKGWERFQIDYLPKIEKFLIENNEK